jgi:hypothetical protein
MKIKYTFQEARRITRKHGFQSPEEFLEYECPGAYGVQKNVLDMYKNDWKGWDDFLGVPPSYEEGKIYLKGKGLCTREEYECFLEQHKDDNDDDLSSRLPWRPDLYYKSEWKSWEDWLTCS